MQFDFDSSTRNGRRKPREKWNMHNRKTLTQDGFTSPHLVRLGLLIPALLVLLFAGNLHAQQLAFTSGIATTLIGDTTGLLAASPDNYSGPASGLVLSYPQDAVFDKNGNLYIADSAEQLIRVIAAKSGTGTIPALPSVTTTAGNVYLVGGNSAGSVSCTTLDSDGDGCPATEAYFYANAAGMAVDSNGNVYIADANSYTVRVIYAAGTIPGLTNPTVGYIYRIAGTLNKGGGSGDDGSALIVELNTNGIAVDGKGNIYIADQSEHTIRVVYSGSGTIPGLPSNPTPGDIYSIAGTAGSTCNTTSTPTCGNGGPATSAFLSTPPERLA